MKKIPPVFDIRFVEELDSDKAFVRTFYNNRQLGERLDDNSRVNDGYRYHDVVHLGLYTFLKIPYGTNYLFNGSSDDIHIKRKEKAEESISMVVFCDALQKNYFKHESPDPYTIGLVRGVSMGFLGHTIPKKKWGQAIENIYDVFRPLYENRGGIVHCDTIKKTMEYRHAAI